MPVNQTSPRQVGVDNSAAVVRAGRCFHPLHGQDVHTLKGHGRGPHKQLTLPYTRTQLKDHLHELMTPRAQPVSRSGAPAPGPESPLGRVRRIFVGSWVDTPLSEVMRGGQGICGQSSYCPSRILPTMYL